MRGEGRGTASEIRRPAVMTAKNDPTPNSDLGPRPSALGPPATGLFLHASSVVMGGEAILFLGHSTAGKSTLARMLGAAYPVLADDAVFMAKRPDGRWGVVDGGFRFGEGDFADWQKRIRRQIDQRSVPLRGCLRIHKAPEIRMGPMEPVELARYLMDAAMEIDLQRKYGRISGSSKMEPSVWDEVVRARRHWFNQAADIARTATGGHFWFSKGSNLAEIRAILEKWPKIA